MASSNKIDKTRRIKITETALALVRDKGYDGVSMRDVADIVGLKAPSMYSHFSSKEEMIVAALELSIEQLRAKLNQELTGSGLSDFEIRLKAIADHLKTERKCVGLHLLYGSSVDSQKINGGLHVFFLLLKESLRTALFQVDRFDEVVIETMVEDVVGQLEGATIWLLLDDNSSAIDRAVHLGIERVGMLLESLPNKK
ncbi:TetR/AcrR family transcriptional regulator [Plesiomonas sp.]|uniref:TetR/AcrR family transcriptional regulator n=1 Tax=Plesiomonas sp. TaxID=2486279 RepID=UPI003F2A9CFD